MIKKLFEKLKTIRLHSTSSISNGMHSCIDNREVIDHLPQFGKTIDGHDTYLGDGYQVRCKVCGKDWFQNFQ